MFSYWGRIGALPWICHTMRMIRDRLLIPFLGVCISASTLGLCHLPYSPSQGSKWQRIDLHATLIRLFTLSALILIIAMLDMALSVLPCWAFSFPS